MLKTLVDFFFEQQKRSVELAKIEAATLYLQAVRAVRRQILAISALVFCLVTAAVSVVALPLAIVLLLPVSWATQCVLLLLLTAAYLGLAAYFIKRFFNEERWIQWTKSDQLLSQVVENN